MTKKESSELACGVIPEMASSCMLMRTRLIARVVTGIYDQALRPFGINSPQFALLLVMCSMGPASRAEIGRFHRQDRSTLTRNLQIMISEGWIDEVEEGAVGRARPMRLTKAGMDLLYKAEPAWQTAQVQTKALLGGNGVIAVMDMANNLLSSTTAV